MKINLLFIFLTEYISINCAKKLPRLTRREILDTEKKKENIGLIYINSRNISHKFFMEEVSGYLANHQMEKYHFGYLDIVNDKNLLDFFKIKNERDSGIIIYKFGNKNYYVGEGINHLDQVIDIFEQIEKNKLNWSTNSLIEAIFFFITGKRYGKEAHSMFSFGICIISILIYMGTNIYFRRQERNMIEKKLKNN